MTDPELQPEHEDPRIVPAITLLRRTGARSVQIRYHDDETPTVWLAVVEYWLDADGLPSATDTGRAAWDVDAGHHPLEALLRLCARRIDGAVCAHCHRPTAFNEDLSPTFADATLCWYGWDPELTTFRRGCEGETPPRPNRAQRRAQERRRDQ